MKLSTLLAVSCLWNSVFVANAQKTEAELEQEEILLGLFASTGGFRWRDHTGWNTGSSVCSYYGITCYSDEDGARNGMVRTLEMEDNKLSGTAHIAEILRLPFIESLTLKDHPDLDIDFTGLEGNTDALKLTELKISGNDLTSIAGVGNLKNLEYLHITDNNLEGPIPDEVFALTKLKGFYANFNKFNGPISPNIQNLSKLEELYLYDNDLSGQIPSQIGKLKKLTIMTLAQNSFTGELPDSLNDLVSIQVLAIQREDQKTSNGITGRLPAFDKLVNLQELYLSNNAITGPIPLNFLAGVSNRADKLKVDLAFNKISGGIPEALLRFPRMSLQLAGNEINEISSDFCSLSRWMDGQVATFGCNAILCPPGFTSPVGRQTSLVDTCEECPGTSTSDFYGSLECDSEETVQRTQLDILENFYHSMDGQFWKNQDGWLDANTNYCDWHGIKCTSGTDGNPPSVSVIFLPNNELVGAVPQDLFSLPDLYELDLSGNAIDFSFDNIGNATNLNRLHLAATGLKKLTGLGQAKNLEHLDLKNNMLTMNSNIANFFKLPKLKTLIISHNDFGRPFPSSIGLVPELEYLHCVGAGLKGKIPKEIGSLKKLVAFDCAENDFTGNIPSEINELQDLVFLSLHQLSNSGPGLTGPLPSFANLTQLSELYLDANDLTGPLPVDLLANSNVLDGRIDIGLSKNKLTGDIPPEYSRFDVLNIDLTDNKIGGIPQELCDSKVEWMEGWVEKYGCDAILCPMETFNTFGRRNAEDFPCKSCSIVGNGLSPFLGATKCLFDTSSSSSLSDHDILEKLFYLTGGRNWKNSENWLDESVSICSWYGVTCGGESGTDVVALNLTENGLSGTLPPAVYHLKSMTHLNVKGNEIKIQFDGIGNATSLEQLYLSETGLSSFDGISNAASSLEILHATDNKLSGSIPGELFKLKKLKQLYLNYNLFSGKVPSSVKKLKKLEELFLYHNYLTGQIPASIGNMTSLKLLAISSNDLSGTLPEELNELVNLEILSLEGNNKRNGVGITGPLLDFSALPNLKELYLNSNTLSGTIPKTFLQGVSNKFDMVKADLISNELTGTIPIELQSFQKLRLYVADNRISEIPSDLCLKEEWNQGDIGLFQCEGILCPPNTYNKYGRHNTEVECTPCDGALFAPFYGSFSCLTDLAHQSMEERKVLELLFNELGGDDWKVDANWMDSSSSICDWYGIECASYDIESVLSIRLAKNNLRGTVPQEIFSLPNLEELDLSHNPIEFSFSGIGDAQNLLSLNLDETGLKSYDGIENAVNLNVLHLMSNNFIQNTIPDVFFSLSQLEVLYLSDNSFSGELPEGLKQLSNLKFFSCYECGLEGFMPEWIGDLTKLEYLRLDGNSFSGSLPADISSMSSLEHLDLSKQTLYGGRGFSGSLPDFSGCSKMTELFLYKNNFSGSIPPTFLSSVNLVEYIEVDLRYNEISGSIPIELLAFEKLTIHLAENKIDSIPESLCFSESLWMDGDVTSFECAGILCPPGTYNLMGRQSSTETPCLDCAAAEYFGSASCLSDEITTPTTTTPTQTDNDSGSDTSSSGGNDSDLSLTEQEILETLFKSTRGSSWKNNTNWLNDNVSVCKWFGISCIDGNVAAIDLQDNGLTGDFLSNVYNLQYLDELNLKGNHINFSFQGIQNAGSLRVLILSDMGLTSIDGVGNAKVLESLHLTDNEVGGKLPKELFDLVSLKRLFANYNKFSGSLPTEVGQLKNMEELYLYHNSLSGQLPSELGVLTKMEIMTLAANIFTGPLPAELNNLENIKIFALQREGGVGDGSDVPQKKVHAGISGNILDFSGWKYIEELYLGSNALSGPIPSTFLSGVEDKNAPIKVDLTLNQLTGFVPGELSLFEDMRLFVAGNKLQGFGEGICDKENWMNGAVKAFDCEAIMCPPESYNEFGRQSSIDTSCKACDDSRSTPYWGSLNCDSSDEAEPLSEMDVLMELYTSTGGVDWNDNYNWGNTDKSVCDWYGISCSSETKLVTKIDLSKNNLKHIFPPVVYQLSALSSLDLHDNPGLDVQFFGIRRANKLTKLNLDSTGVTSMSGIGSASKRLEFLSMQNNNFGGKPIPQELFELDGLKYLNIANSKIGGGLNEDLGKLVSVKELNLSGNDITGPIPESVGNLSKLNVFAMSENRLSGTLPTGLESLVKLKAIHLDQFSRDEGGITGPMLSFRKAPDLAEIYIGSNSLTGYLPSNLLAGVHDIQQQINVVLKSNKLEGGIPETLSRFKRLNIDVSGNKISAIDSSLCEQGLWMGGAVATFSCDAILCPPGTFNLHGRQSTDGGECQKCEGVGSMPYFGALECGSAAKKREREILEKFYHQCGGENWKNNENWLDSKIDYCDFYGVACHEGELVESILMGSNNIVGTPPKELFILEDLKWLWLYANPVEFSFDGIEDAKHLTSLLLDSTSVVSLDGLGKATSLKEIDLRFNNIGGEFPNDELSTLVNLESISLTQNSFTGPVPPVLSKLANLKKIRLGDNNFSGTLPDFADNAELRSIDFSNNMITGSIPATFLKNVPVSTDLFVDLSTNMLTGSVPGSLARFEELTLYLRDNQLKSIDPKLCTRDGWNDGDVGEFGCDGFLCAPGTFAVNGRQSKSDSGCMVCKAAEFYGSTVCGHKHAAGATSDAPSLKSMSRFFISIIATGIVSWIMM